MENRLGYFTIDTPDLARARAFYAGLFGWTFDADSSRSTYAHVTEATGAVSFGIVRGEKRDFSHLYFRVADVDAACARVNELGGRAAVPSDSTSGRSAVVCDDQGVSFGLWQPAPDYA